MKLEYQRREHSPLSLGSDREPLPNQVWTKRLSCILPTTFFRFASAMTMFVSDYLMFVNHTKERSGHVKILNSSMADRFLSL